MRLMQKMIYGIFVWGSIYLTLLVSLGSCQGKEEPKKKIESGRKFWLEEYSDRKFWLEEYFTAPVSEYDALHYPPITTYKQLHDRINGWIVDIDSFESAYERINIRSSRFEHNIFILEFEYKNKVDTAFAYYKPTSNKMKRDVGINIIPGSGINQSGKMYYENDIEKNYQSTGDDILQKYGDVFILVKPNEDFLAIHNGTKKISEPSFVNYLLDEGSSYSAYYLIHGMALSKFIYKNYKESIVAGLSQGGLAAFIIACQSKPGKAIIISGWSVTNHGVRRSNHDQIIIPNVMKTYRNIYSAKDQIERINTQFLFMWGKKEKGKFAVDREEKLTIRLFEDLTNVQIYIHNGGHVYSEMGIGKFFEEENWKDFEEKD